MAKPITPPSNEAPRHVGWQCPICSRVYAPTTPACSHCNDALTVRRSLGARINWFGVEMERDPEENSVEEDIYGKRPKDDPKGAWDEST